MYYNNPNGYNQGPWNGYNNYNGYNGYNGYNMYNPYYNPNPLLIKAKKEKKEIAKIGIIVGLCILAYVFLQNFLFTPILISGTLKNLYKTSTAFQDTVTIFLSICSILVPFYIAGRYIEKKQNTQVFRFEKPKNMTVAFLAIFFGVFACMVAQVAGNYITTFLENIFHTQFSGNSDSFDVPMTVSGRIIYVISIAVVPPLVEETALRGTVLQSLRKHGDIFALIVSAAVFALIHGNISQIPFAFIAGLGLGYVAIVTDSLWPSMIVHFVNNFYACIIEFIIADISNETLCTRLYYIVFFGILVMSIIGSVFFFFIKREKSLKSNNEMVISTSEKAGAFFLNPAMIIAVIVMVIIIIMNVAQGQ